MKTSHLHLRLIIILSLVSLLLWLAVGGIAWTKAKAETDNVFDTQQILFAQRLATSNLRQILKRQHSGKMIGTVRPLRHIPKKVLDSNALAFAIFTQQGDMILSDGDSGDHIAFSPVRGFTTQQFDQDSWRIFWLPSAGGELIIAVGQELEYRKDVVTNMILSQLLVWLAGLPILLALIVFVINRELSPLKRLRQKLLQRSPDDNSPLTIPQLPLEIQPLVNSLNQFFNRTSHMLLRERRFTSDAAHELRSPLTALRVQTEIVQLAGDDHKMRNQALIHLTTSIDRATQLIEQLLTLSRLDSIIELDSLEAIDWQSLINSLLEERSFAANKKQITLIFEQQGTPIAQLGQPLLISLMLQNLINNAIHYCPNGSLVVITLYPDRLVIYDNGKGVHIEELEKLGQRFYRPAGQNEKGSGLGLSIVKRIAELHHYSLTFSNRITQSGFQIEITF